MGSSVKQLKLMILSSLANAVELAFAAQTFSQVVLYTQTAVVVRERIGAGT